MNRNDRLSIKSIWNKRKMSKNIYDPQLTALALNFSEQIFDSHSPSSEEALNKILLIALAEAGHSDICLDKLERSIAYYVDISDGVEKENIYGLAEYSVSLPNDKNN